MESDGDLLYARNRGDVWDDMKPRADGDGVAIPSVLGRVLLGDNCVASAGPP